MTKHEVACFRMPKVASLSLHAALQDKCEMIHHAIEQTDGEILRKYKQENQGVFVFSFVRNPFDRVVSSFCWISKIDKNKRTAEWKKHVDPYNGNFRDFVVSEIGERRGMGILHLRTQYSWIVDLDGKLMVDWIGKFESLQEDLGKLCTRMGWAAVKLEKHNSSVHRSYRDYYTQETAEIVAKAYERDFELGGYIPRI